MQNLISQWGRQPRNRNQGKVSMSRILFTLGLAFFAFTVQAELGAQLALLNVKWPAPAAGSSLQSFSTNGNSAPTTTLAGSRSAQPVLTPSTNWYPHLITRPADRQWIKSMPIANRPNRTFHIYGNAVRNGLLPHGPLGQLVFGK